MSDITAALRNEILEAEKSRYDLLKWKLVLVSGLGAAGLGIGAGKDSSDVPYLDYLLCLIPLVCIYVDVLCLHMNLRIMVIAGFLRTHSQSDHPLNGYEEFAHHARQLTRLVQGKGMSEQPISAFALEDWAIRWSTVILSVLVVLYASVAFSCTDGRWWLPLGIVIVPGMGLAFGLPIVYRKRGFFLSIMVALALVILPYLTVTDRFAWVTMVFLKIESWTVFLTAGMLGLLLTGVMQLIYAERCSAIEHAINQKSSGQSGSGTGATQAPPPNKLV